jgi:hypothetical protein
MNVAEGNPQIDKINPMTIDGKIPPEIYAIIWLYDGS